jgi:hypothetical protein
MIIWIRTEEKCLLILVDQDLLIPAQPFAYNGLHLDAEEENLEG